MTKSSTAFWIVSLSIVAVVLPSHAQVTAPYGLSPADGAVGISLMPQLSWSWDATQNCAEGIGITVFTVYMGTDEQNLSPVGLCCNEGWPETVGPLTANTQYFWQVRVVDEFTDCPGSHEAYSQVHSFTTATFVGVEDGNWTVIKRLYR